MRSEQRLERVLRVFEVFLAAYIGAVASRLFEPLWNIHDISTLLLLVFLLRLFCSHIASLG